MSQVNNESQLIPTNERYVIFLPPKYFKKSIFRSIYNKVKKSIQNKGVSVFNIEDSIDYIKTNLDCKVKFDDKPYPDSNQLYIHLYNSQYYSDNIYNKKKIETEREMLLLLAGKLGVKEINYNTEIIETTLSKLEVGATIKSINNSLNFNKTIERKQGTKGKEIYENRGAPVYLKCNLNEIEENIKNRMGKMESNVFSYEFYKQSPKLESFVYKRCEFKMKQLEYTIESDDITDISFAVKSCFMEWGINFSYNKNTVFNEKITYTLEFFTDEELNLAFNKIKFEKDREKFDPFYSIRETYEAHDDKNTAVHIICEYVMNEASKLHYQSIDSNGVHQVNDFSKLLRKYMRENNTFEDICHNFRSTSQIRNWMVFNLLSDENEIIYPNNNQTTNDDDWIQRREAPNFKSSSFIFNKPTDDDWLCRASNSEQSPITPDSSLFEDSSIKTQ